MFDQTQAASYLAAMIDGEGWVRDPAKNGMSRMLSIANTDPDIIAAICECFSVLGIPFSVSHADARGRHQAIDIVAAYGFHALTMVYELVPIRAQRKRNRLFGLINNSTPRKDIVRYGLKKDELEAAYLTMTLKQMATHFGVGLNTINRAMTHHGVERLPRSKAAERVWASRRANHGPTGRKAPR